MSKKRIGAIWMLLLVLLSLTWVVYGTASDKALGDKWISVLDQYHLTTVSHVPDGITPLHVSTAAALARLLESFKCASSVTLYVDGPAILHTSLIPMSTAIDVIHLHESYICNVVWRTRFNLWADIYRASSGSFHWIDSVQSERVGLTGLHPFMTLSNTWTDHYIYPNQQSARISGGGILDYYLWIQGVLVYYSEPVSLEVVWSI